MRERFELIMLSIGNDLEHERMWNDDQSWAFPIPPVEENGGRKLIDSGKILMNMIGVSNGQAAAEKAPPPPPALKGKKKKTASMNEGKRNGDGNSGDQELHIWTERERRKKMKNMFSNLHALIPHLHPRADKSTIIDEGVAYIKKLQLTLEDLEKLKEKLEGNENANPAGCDVTTITQQKLPIQSREAFLAEQGSTSKQPPVTIANPNTILSGPESQAFFRTWTSPNVVLNICGTDAHINVVCSAKKPGILTAILFVMDKYKLDLVSAQVSSDHTIRMYTIHARVNGGPQQFPEVSFDVEETYKQAAAELMLWVDS